MHCRAPSIAPLVGDIASNGVLPVAACPSREPLTGGWSDAARPAGDPQGQNRKVASYLSVLCDSTATAPAEPELGRYHIHREGGGGVSGQGPGRRAKRVNLWDLGSGHR